MTRTRSLLTILFSAGLFGCDHATKIVAEHTLSSGRVVTLVPKILDLRYTRNDDVAFSALASWEIPHKGALLLAISIFVIAATIAMWIRHRRTTNGGGWNLADIGFAFVLAGALGNVFDRVMRGYVIDFIHVHYENASWPVFNVADACIVLGLIALGLSRSRVRAAPA